MNSGLHDAYCLYKFLTAVDNKRFYFIVEKNANTKTINIIRELIKKLNPGNAVRNVTIDDIMNNRKIIEDEIKKFEKDKQKYISELTIASHLLALMDKFARKYESGNYTGEDKDYQEVIRYFKYLFPEGLDFESLKNEDEKDFEEPAIESISEEDLSYIVSKIVKSYIEYSKRIADTIRNEEEQEAMDEYMKLLNQLKSDILYLGIVEPKRNKK